MGLLKRNNPPYDTFLFRSAARPQPRAIIALTRSFVLIEVFRRHAGGGQSVYLQIQCLRPVGLGNTRVAQLHDGLTNERMRDDAEPHSSVIRMCIISRIINKV